jgi:hypothetical protein
LVVGVVAGGVWPHVLLGVERLVEARGGRQFDLGPVAELRLVGRHDRLPGVALVGDVKGARRGGEGEGGVEGRHEEGDLARDGDVEGVLTARRAGDVGVVDGAGVLGALVAGLAELLADVLEQDALEVGARFAHVLAVHARRAVGDLHDEELQAGLALLLEVRGVENVLGGDGHELSAGTGAAKVVAVSDGV